MLKWLREKLGIVQVEKELTRIYKTVNRLDSKLGKLENRARSGRRPMTHGEVERAQKRRRKAQHKVADIF